MKALIANVPSRYSDQVARIVPIIRLPSNALYALSDHYFMR
jgi:hypothetical protein